jgi:sulfite reductase (NADPH) flavoprotein alpha-component
MTARTLRGSAVFVGNTTVLLALLAIALLLLRWQPQALAWSAPAPGRLGLAMAVVATYLAFCAAMAFIVYRHRRCRTAALAALADTAVGAAGRLLVVHASQTGTAERLAWQTAQMLQAASVPVQMLALAQFDEALLAGAERILFVVATTGEGDPPDGAARFARDRLRGSLALPGLRYGVLALGDRDYDRFCAFGHALDAWLRRQGAQPLFDLVEVDNLDGGALRHWQHHLGLLSGVTDLPDWSLPRYERWPLVERRQINVGSPGDPVFHLALQPPRAAAAWQAGDIAEIGPRHAPARVAEVLDALGLDGEIIVDGAAGQSLADLLSASHLPITPTELQAWRGLEPFRLAAQLQPLPHREYSIASIPADGRLELLVRSMRQADGRPGLGSGWLTKHAALGAGIALRIRSNPGFHPPRPDRPLILIGNGTGLAGLRAHLKARVEAGARRNWLLFGERTEVHDFFHRPEIEAWQRAGFVERLDLAFSRDTPQRIYVQDRLREAQPMLRLWVDQGASIYVCGSLQGMAPAVDAVLREALGVETLERLVDEGRYRRDVY